jgi:hypothetical protein
MADFNPIGQIGGLVRRLPSAVGTVSNFFLPGVGTIAQKYGNKKTLQNIPVGKLTEGAAIVGGLGASIAGGLTSEVGVGIPLAAGGMALTSAAHNLGNEAQYHWNQLMGQVSPQALNGIQTGKYGPTDWNPSANPTTQRGSQQASDRSYQQEKANIAQQAAQNPLFQKYQVADLAKQYGAAKGADRERLGLQIWAQTHGNLAAKLAPGQTGYAEAMSAPGLSNAGTPIKALPLPSFNFAPGSVNLAPAEMQQTFGTTIPGVGMVSATPTYFQQQAQQTPFTPEEMANIYTGKQLNYDPRAINQTSDQRNALLSQYRQMGL